jgi:GTP cyclohydrolase I
MTIDELRQIVRDAAFEYRRIEKSIQMLEAAGEDATAERQKLAEAAERMKAANRQMFALMESDPEAAAVDAQTQAEQRGRRETDDPYGQTRGWGS